VIIGYKFDIFDLDKHRTEQRWSGVMGMEDGWKDVTVWGEKSGQGSNRSGMGRLGKRLAKIGIGGQQVARYQAVARRAREGSCGTQTSLEGV
jgi:hypothetical protein